jgi:hypothetical protein
VDGLSDALGVTVAQVCNWVGWMDGWLGWLVVLAGWVFLFGPGL